MTRKEAIWAMQFYKEKLYNGIFGQYIGAFDVAISALKEQPVVHGRWKFGKNHGEFVETECTACGSLLLVKWIDELSNYRYCPNCGARMDGDSIDK